MCAGRPAGGEDCVKHLTECAALGRPPCCCCCSPPRGLHLGFFSARPWWLRLPVHTARPGPAQQPRPSCALQTPAPAPPPGTHTGHRGTGDTVTGTNGAVVLTPLTMQCCVVYIVCTYTVECGVPSPCQCCIHVCCHQVLSWLASPPAVLCRAGVLSTAAAACLDHLITAAR